MGIHEEQQRREALDTFRMYKVLMSHGCSEAQASAVAELFGLAARGKFEIAEGAARLAISGYETNEARDICAAFQQINQVALREMGAAGN